MKMIIEVPDKVYELAKERKMNTLLKSFGSVIARAIVKGRRYDETGDLISRDELLDHIEDFGEGQNRLMLIDPAYVRTAPAIERKSTVTITTEESWTI